MDKTNIDFSYFALYLKRHLQETGDIMADDNDFINSRATKAEDTYEECRRSGMGVFESQEAAMSILTEDLSNER